MKIAAREEILARLKEAPAVHTDRPGRPALPAESWGSEEVIRNFRENLARLEVPLHQVAGYEEAALMLSRIAKDEGLKRVMASPDEVAKKLSLADWGRQKGVEVRFPGDFATREAYKEAVFNEVDGGITGVDYAIAESGTLCLLHRSDQPRLISLAPITHVALVPAEVIDGVYETVLARIYQGESLPSQVTFITGPSITADIQMTPFRGMHGPRKLIVILIEQP